MKHIDPSPVKLLFFNHCRLLLSIRSRTKVVATGVAHVLQYCYSTSDIEKKLHYCWCMQTAVDINSSLHYHFSISAGPMSHNQTKDELWQILHWWGIPQWRICQSSPSRSVEHPLSSTACCVPRVMLPNRGQRVLKYCKYLLFKRCHSIFKLSDAKTEKATSIERSLLRKVWKGICTCLCTVDGLVGREAPELSQYQLRQFHFQIMPREVPYWRGAISTNSHKSLYNRTTPRGAATSNSTVVSTKLIATVQLWVPIY